MEHRSLYRNRRVAAALALVAIGLGAAGAWAVDITARGKDTPLDPRTFEQSEGPVRLAVANGDVRLAEDTDGGVALLGGTLTLAEGVVVDGPVAVVGGELIRESGSRIGGDAVTLADEWFATAVQAFYGVNGEVTAPSGSIYSEAKPYRVEPEAVIAGDLVVTWGSVIVEGVVEGSILALGSRVTLAESAEVRGDVLQVTTGAEEPLEIAEAAVIRGSTMRIPRPIHAGGAPPLGRAGDAQAEAPEPMAEAPVESAAPEGTGPQEALRKRSLSPVLGGSTTVARGEEVDEVVVLGGRATIEEGAMAGDVVLWGGEAIIDGRVDGDLVVMGGRARLGSQAVVTGDATVMGGEVTGSEGARIEGERVVLGGRIDVPGVEATQGSVDPFSPGKVIVHRTPPMGWLPAALSDLASGLVLFLLGFGLVLLVTGAWPERVEAISSFARWNLGRCIGTGLLGVGVAALVTLVFSLITCLLGAVLAVPVAFVLLWLAHIFGAAGIAALVGNVMLSRTKLSAATLVGEVAAGALALGAIKWIGTSVPVLSTIVSIAMVVLWLVELGAVIETRWGADAAGGGRPWPAGRRGHHRQSPAAPPPAWPPTEDPFDGEWIRAATDGNPEPAGPADARQGDAPAPDSADDPGDGSRG